MKLRNLIRKCKFSEESVYIFTELGNKKKAKEAMYFHEGKVALITILYILILQGAVLLILFI